MLSGPVPISSTIACNKRRVPHPPTPSSANLFSLSIQAQLSCVDVQAQNQAFVHFAVVSSAASTCYRALIDSRFGTFTRCVSRWENPQSPVSSRALHRCCGRNVVVPGQYSKRFLRSNSIYGGLFRPATTRGTPARSVFGEPSRTSPADVIRASISRLWPCPASMTTTPPEQSSRRAWGIRTR